MSLPTANGPVAHVPDPTAAGPDRNAPTAALENVRREIVRGLLYIHSRLNVNTGETLEALALVSALVNALIAKGLITPRELEDSKQATARHLAQEFGERGFGAVLQTAVEDKYAFQEEVTIDCAGRVHLCRAACCRLSFALSKQDVREGIVRWEMEKPYLIAREKDGCCTHLDRGSLGCSVWKNRPAPCRAFDCRRDPRIWVDFEKRVPNPDLARDDWPRCVSLGGDDEGFDVTAMETLEGAPPAPGQARS